MAPLPRPTRLIGYIRVSTEEQARADRSSPTQQRAAIHSLADRFGLPIEQIFDDLGVSGGSAEKRPGFMALVAWCQAHPTTARAPGAVLVLNDSRWGRFDDPMESSYWMMELKKKAGWVVRFVEADDTEDKTVRSIMRALYAGQATAYRDQIKANAARGARGSAAQGFWQNEAPLGYRREARDAAGRARVLEVGQRKGDTERVRLVPGPASEVAAIRWAFETYAATGASLRTIADGLTVRAPARRWSRGTVKALLTNPAYQGDVVWCRRPHDASLKTSDPTVRRTSPMNRTYSKSTKFGNEPDKNMSRYMLIISEMGFNK
jgi:DNA invertase Pin-like site-specific DNA recombinase